MRQSVSLLLVLLVSAPCRADSFEWVGPIAGDWNDPTNWLNTTPGGTTTVPDGDDHVVFNTTLSTGSGTVFTLENTDLFILNGNSSLTVLGPTITNTGTIGTNPGTSGSELRIEGVTSLEGNGVVSFNSAEGSVRITGGGTLINGPDHRISGTNLIITTAGIVNEGTISGSLSIGGNAIRPQVNNAGTLQAAAGDVLELWSEVIGTESSEISVSQNGQLILQPGSALRGGTLDLNPNAQATGTTTLQDITLTGNLSMTSTTLEGTITNNGVLATSVSIHEDVTLAGDGVLAGNFSVFGGRVINGPDHTIQGTGIIASALENQGTLATEVQLDVLVPLDNVGIISVDGFGIVAIINTVIQNAEQAEIRVGAQGIFRSSDSQLNGGGTLLLGGGAARITGSSLEHGIGHTIRGSGQIEVDLENRGAVIVEGGELLLTDRIDNRGSITVTTGSLLRVVDSASDEGEIFGHPLSVMTVEAGAVVNLDNATLAGGRLDVAPNATFTGSGTLDDLELTGRFVQQPGTTNLRDSIENNGELTFRNLNGAIAETFHVSDVTLSGNGELVMNSSDAQITGDQLTNFFFHTIRGHGSIEPDVVNLGTISAEEGTLSVSSINGGGTISVGPFAELVVAGSIDNPGDLTVMSQGTLNLGPGSVLNGGDLHVEAGGRVVGEGVVRDVSLTGTLRVRPGTLRVDGSIRNNGILTFADTPGAAAEQLQMESNALGFSGTGRLVLNDDQDARILGEGFLSNGAAHTIEGHGVIEPAINNIGTIAAHGGRLTLMGRVQHVPGFAETVSVASNGTLVLGADASIIDGNLVAERGARLDGSGALEDIAFSGSLARRPGVTTLIGTIANEGTLTFSDRPGPAVESFQILSEVVMSGPGELLLNHPEDARLVGNGTLINRDGHTIRGSGVIEPTVVNHSVISVEGGQLVFGSDVENAGEGEVSVDRQGILLLVEESILSGGTLRGVDGARIGGNGTLRDVTIAGTIAQRQGTTHLRGEITNNGTLTYEDRPGGTDEVFEKVGGNMSLAGVGELVMNHPDDARLIGEGTLVNGPEHTIRGQGIIDLQSLVNDGVLAGDSPIQQLVIRGSVSGRGPLANVEIQGNHLVGASTSRSSGLYELTESGTMRFQFGVGSNGPFQGRLESSGDVFLAGTLSVEGTAAFDPKPGDSFEIISAAGELTGAFRAVTGTQPDGLTRDLFYDYDASTVTLFYSGAVAQQSTWNINASGDWSDPAAWTLGTPAGDDHIAVFGSVPATPTTISLDTQLAVGRVQFDHHLSYAIGGRGGVHLLSSRDAAAIAVARGHHQLQVELHLESDANVDTADGSSLALNNEVRLKGHTLTKTGDGELLINSHLVASGGSIEIEGGTVMGGGSVAGDVNNAAGTVAPGNSPGVLTVLGDYHQGEAATLAVEIGGPTAGLDHDVLVVRGTAFLAGVLDVVLLGDFSPQLDDAFVLLGADEVEGQFQRLSLPQLAPDLRWNTRTLYTHGRLRVEAVPEPSTALLVMLALVSVLASTRTFA